MAEIDDLIRDLRERVVTNYDHRSTTYDVPVVGPVRGEWLFDHNVGVPYFAAEAEMMSAIEYDCEMESCEITLRELDRETRDVIDISHVTDPIR